MMARYGRKDKEAFRESVELWKRFLSSLGKDRLLVVLPFPKGKQTRDVEGLFFEAACLSRACSETGVDLFLYGSSRGMNDCFVKNLVSVWNGRKSGSKEVDEFVNLASHLMKGKDKLFFRSMFEPAEVVNLAESVKGLEEKKTSFWWKKRIKNIGAKLEQVCDAVWKNSFNPKKRERLQVRFELVPEEEGLVFEDYLDNFIIAWFMIFAAAKKGCDVSFKAHTMRKNAEEFPEKSAELANTLAGCHLSMWKREKVFSAYRKMSSVLNLQFEVAEAVFGISGNGFYGRHVFGEAIGYPVKCGKSGKCSKWTSPGQIIFKFPWLANSAKEERPPLSRIGFTQTVPVEEFVASNDIDWKEMRMENRKIELAMKKCDVIEVRSGKGSNFRVCIRKPDGSLRGIKRSDADARFVVNPELMKKEGKAYGMMANIPGGECFVTPEWVEGRIVGDVVVSIDRSYVLSWKRPLVIEASKKGYEIKKGPKDVVSAIEKHRNNAWQSLLRKRTVLSKQEFELMKANFAKIGEFAVNTNQKAPLSRYLIVSEKIAGMIHVALGAGYDADRATTYHYDVVINAKRQKLDIFGSDSKGRRVWIMRGGRLVV
ncbi:hypothetical protein D6764_02825 [Candidatus Woesearchaeota archaeon]|nr:MAG: hypothetical protein D6764_02825 [Candidatus Woesearchaeota archaeon]